MQEPSDDQSLKDDDASDVCYSEERGMMLCKKHRRREDWWLTEEEAQLMEAIYIILDMVETNAVSFPHYISL